jgi:hypothetical protein
MRQRLAQVAERMKAAAGVSVKGQFCSSQKIAPEKISRDSAEKSKNSLFLDSIDDRLPAIPTGVLVEICAFE